jgi:hypothetical protein
MDRECRILTIHGREVNPMTKARLDVIANVVIIATGLTGVSALGYRAYAANQQLQQKTQVETTGYSVGEKLNTGQLIDFSRSPRNAIVSINTGCRHCASVMPFIKRTAEAAGGRARLVLIGEQSRDVLQSYLREHQLEGVDFVSLPPGTVKIRAVPTFIITDSEGKFLKSWTGRLNKDREDEVMSALGL